MFSRMLRGKWALALGALIVLGMAAGPAMADEGRRGAFGHRSFGGGDHRSYGDYGGYHRPPPPVFVHPRPIYVHPYGGYYYSPRPTGLSYSTYYTRPSCIVTPYSGYIYSTSGCSAGVTIIIR